MILLRNLSDFQKRQVVHVYNGPGVALCGSEPHEWTQFDGHETDITCARCRKFEDRCVVCGQPVRSAKS